MSKNQNKGRNNQGQKNGNNQNKANQAQKNAAATEAKSQANTQAEKSLEKTPETQVGRGLDSQLKQTDGASFTSKVDEEKLQELAGNLTVDTTEEVQLNLPVNPEANQTHISIKNVSSDDDGYYYYNGQWNKVASLDEAKGLHVKDIPLVEGGARQVLVEILEEGFSIVGDFEFGDDVNSGTLTNSEGNKFPYIKIAGLWESLDLEEEEDETLVEEKGTITEKVDLSLSQEEPVFSVAVEERLSRLRNYLRVMHYARPMPSDKVVIQQHGLMHDFLLFELSKEDKTDLDKQVKKAIFKLFEYHGYDGKTLSPLRMNRKITSYCRTKRKAQEELLVLQDTVHQAAVLGSKANINWDAFTLKVSPLFNEKVAVTIKKYAMS